MNILWTIKQAIKKILPKPILNLYHLTLALLASIFYGFPSNKMIVVGITGTKGKSTSVKLITKILETAGFKVGSTSTVEFKVGQKTWLNDKKMTMVGRFALQKLLKDMVKAKCQYAVIETSSEGIAQYRHVGIKYDIAVFTNLTPEHIESHGNFDNYKAAKLKLFARAKNTIVVNGDDAHASEFINFKVLQKYSFQIDNRSSLGTEVEQVIATNLKLGLNGSSFNVEGINFSLKLLGVFNVYNALAAIAAAQSQNIDLATCKKALEQIKTIPGRLEFIDEGQNFQIIVDYAYDPRAFEQLFSVIKEMKPKGKVIHVFGATGGGRDKARQPVMGKMSGGFADVCVITNDDPYDDDPQTIINRIAEGVKERGKKENENLFLIEDRRQAINKALTLAQKNDIVLITGKGAEQALVLAGNKKIPWDDRRVAREELKNTHARKHT